MAKAWEDFLDDTLPDLPGCPQPLAVNAIKQAAIEFCDNSFVFQINHPAIDAVATIGEYAWAPRADLKVVRPERVWYDKKPLTPLARRDLDALYAYWPGQEGTPTYFVQEKIEKLILVPKPSAALVGGILAKVSARPARSATAVDDELWEKYLEVIASGAKAKLFAMKKKPWTDSALANYHRQLFEDGIARAKIAATRGHGRAKLRTQAHFF